MSRRQSREVAMQILFQVDVGEINPDYAFQRAAEENMYSKSIIDFARQLVQGTLEHREHIDNTISKLSKGWRIERLANVDKAILRMAIYEILYEEKIPPVVSANEAVELAKVYGGKDSGKFVNGIVGNVLENLGIYKAETSEINEKELELQ